jgi:hypothetical protein
MARDISVGEAAKTDCIFFSKERLSELYKRLSLRNK